MLKREVRQFSGNGKELKIRQYLAQIAPTGKKEVQMRTTLNYRKKGSMIDFGFRGGELSFFLLVILCAIALYLILR